MAEPTSIHAIGKRKSAVARIYLRPGNGRITVNQRNFEKYFPKKTHAQSRAQAPGVGQGRGGI